MLTFTVDRIFRLCDSGSLKGFADVTVNDALVVKGVRIVAGKGQEPFAKWPQKQGKDNKWYDQVLLKHKSDQEAFNKAVIDQYNEEA